MNLYPLMAFLLLSAPQESPVPAYDPILAATLQATALRWEIMDPREAKYFLTVPGYFAADVKRLRVQWQELAGAPFVCDAERFPERTLITGRLVLNRSYRDHLHALKQMTPQYEQEYQEAMEETERLRKLWDTLGDARNENYNVSYRRQCLKVLENLVGPEAYLSGRLPPVVPLWYFREITP